MGIQEVVPLARCYILALPRPKGVGQHLNAAPNSSPVAYRADGAQYVAVVAGAGGPLDAFGDVLTPELTDPGGSTTLWVFKLRDAARVRR